jgi:hypothetical protein
MKRINPAQSNSHLKGAVSDPERRHPDTSFDEPAVTAIAPITA